MLAIVRAIPLGKVMTYGGIATEVGVGPREVGWILAGLSELAQEEQTPWWRVVGANGVISTFRRDEALGRIQSARLAEEGVPFDERGRVRLQSSLF